MENEHVISGLIRKRAELAGEIDALEGLMREKLIQLDHIDAAIRIFDPSVDLEEVVSGHSRFACILPSESCPIAVAGERGNLRGMPAGMIQRSAPVRVFFNPSLSGRYPVIFYRPSVSQIAVGIF